MNVEPRDMLRIDDATPTNVLIAALDVGSDQRRPAERAAVHLVTRGLEGALLSPDCLRDVIEPTPDGGARISWDVVADALWAYDVNDVARTLLFLASSLTSNTSVERIGYRLECLPVRERLVVAEAFAIACGLSADMVERPVAGGGAGG